MHERPQKTYHPLSFNGLICLFGRPQDFFSGAFRLNQKFSYQLLIFLCGLEVVTSQIRLQAEVFANPIIKQTPPEILVSWSSFWSGVWFSAILFGAVIWYLLGFWYTLRARWCGYDGPDAHVPRLIYIYSSAISAIPQAILLLGQTLIYPNFLASHVDSDQTVFLMISVILAVLSIWVSYTGVQKVLGLSGFKTRLWFLILPLMLQVITLFSLLFIGGSDSTVI